MKISKKKLEKLYITHCYNATQIAKMYNVTYPTILYYLDKFKIKHKSLSEIMTKYKIDNVVLIKMYNAGCTYKQIAEKFNCTIDSVIHRVEKLNLPKRPHIAKRNPNYNEKMKIEQELLISLYWGNEYTMKKISNIFKCSQATIYGKFKKYKIPMLTQSEVQIRNGNNVNEKNPSWKGGISSMHQRLRRGRMSSIWRKYVLMKDKHCCQICYSKSALCAHHIKSFSDFPEERFNVDNGITLCKNCHKWVHYLNPLSFQ